MIHNTALDAVKILELNAERARLAEAQENTQPWYQWGPYLTERQWGTVREDYSPLVLPGTSFPMTMPAHARTGGAKTVCWVSVTKSVACVSL